MIRWRPPGPYEVAFSTREGGVSEGPYASLNLGRMSGDDVDRVDENRRRLCAEIGADPLRLALNRQVHSTLVHRAEPGARGEPGDGLWTEEPDLPLLALTADCVPIALARVGGDRPGVAVLHVGWRGLLAGIVAAGSEGARRTAARGGRSRDRAVLLRGGRRGLGAVRGCVRAGRAARQEPRSVERRRPRAPRGRRRGSRARRPLHPLQSRALLLASAHRAATGRPGSDRACRLSSVRAAYERIRAEVGPDVTVVAATKYVSLEEMAVLAEAGVEVVGENRAQDLERKHAVYGDAFRWHFIGHLQSNKAKVVNGICELVHSLGSESAAARLTVPALVEVNLSGEDSKSGVPPERLPDLLRLLRRRARPDDHAAAGCGSRGIAPVLPPPAGARSRVRPPRALDGHLAGLPRCGGGGSHARACRLRPL